ncbi:MAG: hypothetical protein KA362_00635 [Chloroflexi bacterium]|nr:hypothetical protein [Chloroflexota bacterium]
MDTSDMTLNVIYTANTALPLSRFALTLLRWSACRVRLVANGCAAEEEARLQTLALGNPRLSFFSFSPGASLTHGQVLNHLHDECDEPIFAFVDSDLFAVGPFMPAKLSAPLVCFLPPAAFWTQEEEGRQRQRHRLGCTYFALYDNQVLRDLRRRWGVGFDKGRWKELSQTQQTQLQALNYVQPRYDTGKLLNALLASEGKTVAFADTSNLRHLGGSSRSKMMRHWTWRHWLRRLLTDWRAALRRRRLRQAKSQADIYFAELLDALAQGSPLPDMPRCDPYVRNKITVMTAEIIQLHTDERLK